MLKSIKSVARLMTATVIAGAAPAGATVLSFDDLPAATAAFLANYNGFTFGTNNAQTTAWLHSSEASTFYVPSSGSVYAVTDAQKSSGDIFEDSQPISRATPFIFDGASFSGINQVRYTLYNGSTQVYLSPDSPELPRGSSIFIPSGYGGLITSVVISGRQGFFAVDDFTFTSPVPEPATFGMFALGILGICGYWLARRRRHF